MQNSPDPDDDLDGLPAERMTEDEREEWYETNLGNNMYFRLNDRVAASSVDEVLKLLNDRSFWPAFYVWFQGKLYELEKGYEDPLAVFGS